MKRLQYYSCIFTSLYCLLHNTRIFICALGLFFATPVTAQIVTISTQIFDNQKQGIPFATLTVKKYSIGSFADSIGKITLQIPNNKADTLLISALGYHSKQFFWKDLPQKIVLEDDIINLSQAEVIAKKTKNYTKYFGEVGKGLKFAQLELKGNKGSQYAYFVENEVKQDGYIKNVAFNFGIFEKQRKTRYGLDFTIKNWVKKHQIRI